MFNFNIPVHIFICGSGTNWSFDLASLLYRLLPTLCRGQGSAVLGLIETSSTHFNVEKYFWLGSLRIHQNRQASDGVVPIQCFLKAPFTSVFMEGVTVGVCFPV